MLWNKLSKRQQGQQYEQLACQYLQQHGLQLVSKNFTCKLGEIDLVMNDADCLVFVEVKYRKNSKFGSAAEMVNHTKQQKIIKTAQLFLQKRGLSEYNTACRFDVVSITGSERTPEYCWHKNAFYGE
ncbi:MULTISPECIES: YraN family protein [unclassified Thalassotalea]|uniref:YraN family protein n=1 Tax=unclassified Thalassotalea TaxID=2614972 RepID=UPI0010800F23|nr:MULTISPECIES: YraN family protein [unclassified Thalassotalea]NMP15753.1 YraN family protein [Thalassotalea sp. Y01]QBY04805.1 YraN family protein [Thalassotalea sp. HSM 43]